MTARSAVGLMSGTAMDGIDAALLAVADNAPPQSPGSLSVAYEPERKKELEQAAQWVRELYARDENRLLSFFADRRRAAAGDPAFAQLAAIERRLTDRCADLVEALLQRCGVASSSVSCVGFHGQTVLHRPPGAGGGRAMSLQLGDGERLASRCGIATVSDFRQADLAAGGQGAPLAPLYHRARFGDRARAAPLMIVNIGGVANVTWLCGDEAIAFDCGPGVGMMDRWMKRHFGTPFDAGGKTASQGRVCEKIAEAFLRHPYLARPPPKSLDNADFDKEFDCRGLTPQDGMATLCAMTVAGVAAAARHVPQTPKCWLIAGGGRRNDFLMSSLSSSLATLGASCEPCEAVGVDGDMLEAEAFAWLSLRSLDGLPLSLPSTTGAAYPCSGGVCFRPAAADLSPRAG